MLFLIDGIRNIVDFKLELLKRNVYELIIIGSELIRPQRIVFFIGSIIKVRSIHNYPYKSMVLL